jgi:uncharacterized damage-inducible protein DinB
MGFAKHSLQLDWDFSEWANRRLLRACSGLSVAELTQEMGPSHGSVLRTLQHIYGGEQFWSENLQSGRMPPMDVIARGGTPPQLRLEELEREWPPVWTGLAQWLTTLGEEELERTLTCRLSAEKEAYFTRWQLLRHCVNHSTLHRGQIVGMLRAIGQQPPSVDLLTYYQTIV